MSTYSILEKYNNKEANMAAPPIIPLISDKDVGTKPVKKQPNIPMRKIIPLVQAEEVIPTKPSKEPTGVKPIIPTGDTCCVGVCTFLNNEIEDISQAINIRQEEMKLTGSGLSRMKVRRQVAVLTTKISTLKDLRFKLYDKQICKCVELTTKK
jgi:hypothetical protein